MVSVLDRTQPNDHADDGSFMMLHRFSVYVFLCVVSVVCWQPVSGLADAPAEEAAPGRIDNWLHEVGLLDPQTGLSP